MIDDRSGEARVGSPVAVTAGRTRTVMLREYPVDLRAALYTHWDDLMRELRLVELGGADASSDLAVPARMREAVVEVRLRYRELLTLVTRQTNEATAALAIAPGTRTDVTLRLDPDVRYSVQRLIDLIEETDSFAADGRLLTSVIPPRLRRFRDWGLHEIVAQLDGQDPQSWSEWSDRLDADARRLADDVGDLFRLMADAAPVLIWVSTPDGLDSYFNRGWQDYSGLDLNVGDHRWVDLLHPDDRRGAIASFRAASREGQPYETEYRLRRRDGVYRWFLDRGVPRFDALGRLRGMVGSCVDITEGRMVEDELRLNEAQAQLAFEAGNIGYWRWHSVSGVLEISPPVEALLGLAAGEAPRTFDEYLELVHPDDRSRLRDAAIAATDSGRELRVEHRVLRGKGEDLWLEVRGQPVLSGIDPSGAWVGVAIDTTAATRSSMARAELLGDAVKARRDVERVNATLRRAVGRLDTMVRQEHHIADTLQRALFTDEVPTIAGLTVAARYLPGSAELTVGGDWYDVIERPSGALLVIGDVAGHGLQAAAVMARIRHALQFAVDEVGTDLDPAGLVSRLNRYVLRGTDADLATVCLLEVDWTDGTLHHVSAGHLPPVLVPASGGEPRLLSGGLGPPLGAVDDLAYPGATNPFNVGDRILLYTDGLIERRGEPIDRALRRLVGAVRSAPIDVEAMADTLLDTLLEDEPTDDVALLVARLDRHLSMS